MIWATYYGWYDNTPPGCATAYAGCAKGRGTYGDPITFASDRHEFPIGSVLYYPTIEKYIVMGDDCQECDQDWSGKGPAGGPRFRHVDIWTGGKNGNEFDAINCEDALTEGLPNGAPLATPFIVNPPANEPVSKEPLFDGRTGHCFGGVRTAATHGRYRNALSQTCLAVGRGQHGRAGLSGPRGGKPPWSAVLVKCGPQSSEDLAFDGAFFVDRGRCLHTAGRDGGWQMNFAKCTGGPREQWSVNPNGTITWIQYTRCVADAAASVKLTRCSGTTADRWKFSPESR